jgi:nitrilase
VLGAFFSHRDSRIRRSAIIPWPATAFTDDEWINTGDAVVVRPGGALATGPQHKDKSIVYATVDPETARASRKSLDVVGHYGRPDVFQLSVDRSHRDPVQFVETE